MRKKTPRLYLTLSDASGRELFHDRLERLMLPNAELIRLSTEYFDDPTPCEIHRSAAAVRAFEELKQSLKGKERTEIARMASEVRGYLGAYPQAAWALMKEECG